MLIFLTTIALFLGSMVVHFVIWKVRLPKHQIAALLVVFVIAFGFWLAASLFYGVPFRTILHVTLYYWSVSLSYAVTYSAIEADSPTLSLMRFVAIGGVAGRSPAEIGRFMDERPFLSARLTALINSGLIRQESGRYVAVGRAPFGFRLIYAFRKLYGSIPKGG